MPPRPPAQNQRIRDERTAQILRAAAHVFARNGLAATKITDIGDAAGISHGLVYHYFDSKEEIFRLLITRALQGTAHLLQAARTRPGTVTERLDWLIRELLGSAGEGEDQALLILHALISETVPEDVRWMVTHEPPKLLAELSALFREGQETGEILDGDPDQLAYFFLSGIQGIVSSRALYSEQSSIEPDLLLHLFQAR
jgi:AcrR family transcriptional regulator